MSSCIVWPCHKVQVPTFPGADKTSTWTSTTTIHMSLHAQTSHFVITLYLISRAVWYIWVVPYTTHSHYVNSAMHNARLVTILPKYDEAREGLVKLSLKLVLARDSQIRRSRDRILPPLKLINNGFTFSNPS